MQIEINAKTVGAFILGAAIASALVYFAAVRPLQSQTARDKEALERRATDAETQLSQLRTAVMQYQADRAIQMQQTVAAPTSAGSASLDALNAVRPGLGTAIAKAAPVINRAVQQWKASHAVAPAPVINRGAPITISPMCRSLDETSAERNLTDSEKAAYRSCWGSDPPTHADTSLSSDCKYWFEQVRQRILSDDEMEKLNACKQQ